MIHIDNDKLVNFSSEYRLFGKLGEGSGGQNENYE